MNEPPNGSTTQGGSERKTPEPGPKHAVETEHTGSAETEGQGTAEAEPRAPAKIHGAEQISEYKRKMAEIDRLGDEIAVLSTQIQAATYELLVRLREFDKREGWGHHGARSCAHWLAWRTSLDMGAAREKVRVARALEHLPALSEAMRKGWAPPARSRTRKYGL